jgi:hypothetical protein
MKRIKIKKNITVNLVILIMEKIMRITIAKIVTIVKLTKIKKMINKAIKILKATNIIMKIKCLLMKKMNKNSH